MKANEYIKKFGLVSAKKHLVDVREAVNQVPHKHSLEDFSIDLKRLIESHELVKKHGGLFQSKVQLDKFGFSGGLEWYGLDGEYGLTDDNDLKQAIKDVESCQ